MRELTSKSEFDTLIGGDTYTLVMFTTVWSGPGKRIKPTFEKLAQQHDPDIAFATVDIEAAADISQEVGIGATPTFILFHQGEKVRALVGADPSALNDIVATAKTA
ncbi:thioredoxin family protein [Streptomyces sp. NBC_01565]|uniref:thioredoxin family protein n=1 Tax=Streptomyces sp. NBC_01565 TaxID=2975881 RepID=UPI002257FCBC|nr:thioredoxin family protein [Streptomyces sp. NBC_01565]MCX4547181.1 thioredoxin family protein [Streptomyces sp. NBC_01565]